MTRSTEDLRKALIAENLPEKRLAPGDVKTTSESSSFYFRCQGFDEAIDQLRQRFNLNGEEDS